MAGIEALHMQCNAHNVPLIANHAEPPGRRRRPRDLIWRGALRRQAVVGRETLPLRSHHDRARARQVVLVATTTSSFAR